MALIGIDIMNREAYKKIFFAVFVVFAV